jgi:1-deoxy-D-xylulose-5-phosphate synthase
MFEEMGLQYAGPIDGHDIKRLVETLSWAKSVREPVVIHSSQKRGGVPLLGGDAGRLPRGCAI